MTKASVKVVSAHMGGFGGLGFGYYVELNAGCVQDCTNVKNVIEDEGSLMGISSKHRRSAHWW